MSSTARREAGPTGTGSTGPGGREPRQVALDGLRGLAALAVLLTHVGFQSGSYDDGLLGRVLGRFDLGVALFFALSGYLLHLPFARAAREGLPAPDAVAYLVRRAARVLPLYWVVLALVAVAVGPSAGRLAANVLLVQIYPPDALLPAWTQTWSLSTEVSFYLVLPLLAWWLARRRRPAVAVCGLAVVGLVCAAAAAVVTVGGEAVASRWLPAHLSWFCAGLLLAQARVDPDARWSRRLHALARLQPGTCLVVALAAFLVATTPLGGPLTLEPFAGWEAVTKEALGAVVAFAVLLPFTLGDTTALGARSLGGPVGRYLGEVSYGVFLWHLPVLEAFYAVSGTPLFGGHLWFVVAVVVPVTLGLATLTYHLVERPLVRRAHLVRRGVPPG
jgi:peptidoglycan/LPS O-acetylase OafA/YrhL